MSKSSTNRRQFLKQTGKASIAIAAMPLVSSFTSKNFFANGDFQQQPLPYAFNALEPYIDAMTMEIHYTKHAATYAKNVTDACVAEKIDTTQVSLVDVLKNISKYSAKMRNNAGGHYNHELFWQLMKPAPNNAPSGSLAEAINKSFGNFAEFQKAFGEAAKARFGSGWAWLLVKADGSLAVSSTPNQDNPLMDVSDCPGTPVLGLDVWEHAYYLNYQNRRPDYISSFFHVINWNAVNERYAAAIK
jgi:Fe-Mn family superoxide dismutase